MNIGQSFCDPLFDLGPAQVFALNPERLGHYLLNGEAVADRLGRVLMDHPYPGGQGAGVLLEQDVHVPILIKAAALVRVQGSGRDQGQGGLARAGFAHQTENLSGLQVQVHGPQGRGGAVGLGHPLEFQQIHYPAPDAADQMVPGRAQGNGLPATALHGLGAAGQKEAAPGRGVAVPVTGARSGHVAVLMAVPLFLGVGVDKAVESVAPDAAQLPAGVQPRVGPGQSQGVGVAGLVKQILGRKFLHDLTQVEHGHLIGQIAGQVQVVGYEENALPFFPQPPDGLGDKGLGHRVQGRGGFVQDQDRRVQDQGHGQKTPLHLPAAELVGIAADLVRLEPHGQEFLPGLLAGFPGRCSPLLDQGLGHLIQEAVDRVQIGRPVLKNKGRPGPAQSVEGLLVQADHLFPSQADGAFDSGVGGQKPQDGFAQGGLAGPGFAHQSRDPARGQDQIDPVQGQEGVVAVLVGHGQVFYCYLHRASFKRGSNTFSSPMARKVEVMISRVRQTMGGRSQLNQISR